MRIIGTKVCDGGGHIILLLEDGKEIHTTRDELNSGQIPVVVPYYNYKDSLLDSKNLIRQVDAEKAAMQLKDAADNEEGIK